MTSQGKTKRSNTYSTRELTIISLFIAIELVMYLMGLGKVPFGIFNLSLLTIPVALGALLIGPLEGGMLGLVFGMTSLYSAMTGTSGLTSLLYDAFPVHTIILCVGMRTLMGVCTGYIFRGLRKIDKTRTISYYVGAIAAPLLNTLFFMGYICIFLFGTAEVQSKTGGLNPLMWVVAAVGAQGLIEAGVCCFVGGSVGKGVAHALKMDR